MSGSRRNRGFVVDPRLINYERESTAVFVPAPGQTYAVITKATNGGPEVPQTESFELFESADEALAVSSAFNNGLDDIDSNHWGVTLVTAPPAP